MRILLLPLTRRQTLLYAQRLTENESHKPSPYLTWALNKAQKTWADWGKSETKWKAKTVATGNNLLDKIDWEEYALKTVHDPKSTTSEKIPVVHPSWVEGGQVNEIISEIVKRRRPIHQAYRWRWALVIPLSAPFSLVPVLPNLPFFYAAYRLWSHHKALKATGYLEQLLESNSLISEPSTVLDKIYAIEKPPILTLQDVTLGSSSSELLLGKGQLEAIATEFKDDEIAVMGKRAINQLTKQLDGDIVKREEEKRQQHEADAAATEKSDIKVKETEDQGKGQ